MIDLMSECVDQCHLFWNYTKRECIFRLDIDTFAKCRRHLPLSQPGGYTHATTPSGDDCHGFAIATIDHLPMMIMITWIALAFLLLVVVVVVVSLLLIDRSAFYSFIG